MLAAGWRRFRVACRTASTRLCKILERTRFGARLETLILRDCRCFTSCRAPIAAVIALRTLNRTDCYAGAGNIITFPQALFFRQAWWSARILLELRTGLSTRQFTDHLVI